MAIQPSVSAVCNLVPGTSCSKCMDFRSREWMFQMSAYSAVSNVWRRNTVVDLGADYPEYGAARWCDACRIG